MRVSVAMRHRASEAAGPLPPMAAVFARNTIPCNKLGDVRGHSQRGWPNATAPSPALTGSVRQGMGAARIREGQPWAGQTMIHCNRGFEELDMLMRILTMRVAQERLEDWKRYTKEIGFPGMLAQPGCGKI